MDKACDAIKECLKNSDEDQPNAFLACVSHITRQHFSHFFDQSNWEEQLLTLFRLPTAKNNFRESLNLTTIPGTPPHTFCEQRPCADATHDSIVFETTGEVSRNDLDDDIFIPETQVDPSLIHDDASTNGSDFFHVQPVEYESAHIILNTQTVEEENCNKPIEDEFVDELMSAWKNDVNTASENNAITCTRNQVNGSITPDLEFVTAESNDQQPRTVSTSSDRVEDIEMSMLTWNEESIGKKTLPERENACRSVTPDLVFDQTDGEKTISTTLERNDQVIPPTAESEFCGFSQQQQQQQPADRPSDYDQLEKTQIFVRPSVVPNVDDDADFLAETQIFVAPLPRTKNILHNDDDGVFDMKTQINPFVYAAKNGEPSDDIDATQLYVAPQPSKISSFCTAIEEDEDIFSVNTQTATTTTTDSPTKVAQQLPKWQYCLSSSSDDDDIDNGICSSSPTTKYINKTLGSSKTKSTNENKLNKTTASNYTAAAAAAQPVVRVQRIIVEPETMTPQKIVAPKKKRRLSSPFLPEAETPDYDFFKMLQPERIAHADKIFQQMNKQKTKQKLLFKNSSDSSDSSDDDGSAKISEPPNITLAHRPKRKVAAAAAATRDENIPTEKSTVDRNDKKAAPKKFVLKTKISEMKEETKPIPTPPPPQRTSTRSRREKRDKSYAYENDDMLSTKPVVGKQNVSSKVATAKQNSFVLPPPPPPPLKRSSNNRSNQSTSSSESSDSSDKRRSSRAPSKAKILFTMIDSAPFQNDLQKMGAEVVDTPAACTMLIATKVFRTYKFLSVIASGMPIVNEHWLSETIKSRKILPTAGYELVDNASEARYNFNLAESLKIARNQRLYKNYSIYVTGNTRPMPFELDAIIKSAGGKCIQNLEKGKPNADDIILAVSCKEDRQQWPLLRQRHPKITIINTEGFMLSIMRQHIDFKRYILH